MTKVKKILFVYMSTGGGHLAPVKAIADYLALNYPGQVETVLVDPLPHAGSFVQTVIEDGYRVLQTRAKWIYELVYAIYKIKAVSYISAQILSASMKKYLRDVIQKEQPDEVVVAHFFGVFPVYQIRQQLKASFGISTIVTDPYTAHPLWFLQPEQKFIVFSERLKKKCVEMKFNPEDVRVFPFILNPRFSKLPTAVEIAEFKTRFGFKHNKMVLVLGGGDGIPKGKSIIDGLLTLPTDFDIAVVCGRNEKLFSTLSSLKSAKQLDNLHIFGFVDFVYELLCCSNFVVTKCGASTFMEILMMKKIPLVNSYIWEQEKGNVEYLIENNLGIYESSTRKLPGVIDRLLHQPGYAELFQKNIDQLNPENGTSAVADFIIESCPDTSLTT